MLKVVNEMKLHEALGINLDTINGILADVVQTDADLSSSSLVSRHIHELIAAGGKRLRPMMVIVGGRFGTDGYTEDVLQTAAVAEYYHMASLVHDDIIDRSDLRRGKPTLHKLTDTRTAVLIANYMMTRSLEWAMDRTRRKYGKIDNRYGAFASTAIRLCLGEYGQLHNRFNFDLTLEQYLEKTKNKTAVLMAACLKAGAEAARADEETRRLLYDFGEALGMSFQIRDDVLDFTQSAEAIGKPAGADLRNGNITLPVLYALEDPKLEPAIRSLDAHSTEEQFQSVVKKIADSPAMDRTLAMSAAYLHTAEEQMKKLSAHPAHKDLCSLLHYFVQ